VYLIVVAFLKSRVTSINCICVVKLLLLMHVLCVYWYCLNSLEASFAALDTDKSGFISAQEMESSLLKLGVIGAKMTKDQVQHHCNCLNCEM
jgi:Ca2+-binding EF-hand superfamily protein